MKNGWIQIAVWSALILAVFGYLWWQGQIQRLSVYVRETREELKKCSWPTWIELRGSTILIIVTIGLLGAFVVLVDNLLFLSFFNIFIQIIGIVAISVVLAVKVKRQ